MLCCAYADPESVVREGPTLTTFFFFTSVLVHKGRVDPHTTSASKRNTIKWRFAGVPMMAHH